MELRHLRYFIGAAEEQHFGRAAGRLHVVQSALSRQIQDFERELGFQLFDRLPRGVRLNAAGEALLEDARRILKDIDVATQRSEQIALGRTGLLRIGIATAVPWHGKVADCFRDFRAAFPDAQLELHHMLSPHQVEAVASRRLDVGLAAGLLPLHQDVACRQFAQDRMLLAAPDDHAVTQRKRVHLRDLQAYPFVWFYRWVNPTFYDQLMQACASGGLNPRVVQEAADRDTNLGLVKCRVGVAWHNETLRWHCPHGIALVPVVDMKVRLPFNLIWLKDNRSPLLKKFVAQLST